MPDVPNPCEARCQPARCASVFAQLMVTPTIAGGTVVQWRLADTFADPLPYTLQLQVGASEEEDDAEWEDVGDPQINTTYLVDDEQRVFGKTQWTRYRVKLTTSLGTYVSSPEGCFGKLDRRHWGIYREVLRRESLMLRKETGQEGYLLKTRYTGELCPRCIDYMTREPVDAFCPVCYGTGRKYGYYRPIPCVYAALEPWRADDVVDPQGTRGTINDIKTKARMLGVPDVVCGDVWISKNNDLRWNVLDTNSIVEVLGVPAVGLHEIALLPFSDPTYQMTMES